MSEPIDYQITDVLMQRLDRVQQYAELDSTNVEAMRQLQAGETGCFLLLAHTQSAGRGRRGRHWHSPAGAGLYMTLVRPFAKEPHTLQSLSLVTALSVQQALQACGAANIKLKWPNDLLVQKKKLAGILLELKSVNDLQYVLFGIGINLALPDAVIKQIDQPATDLSRVIPRAVDKSEIAERVTEVLLDNLEEFEQTAFSTFYDRWNALDHYQQEDIVLQVGEKQKIGKSLGVDESGALLLQTANGVETISGGEIFPSLRAAGGEQDR